MKKRSVTPPVRALDVADLSRVRGGVLAQSDRYPGFEQTAASAPPSGIGRAAM